MVEIRKELSHNPSIIKYTGIFNYKELYETIAGWFKSKEYDLFEKNYVHKGNELEFEWEGRKKVTSYYKYEIQVSLKVWDLKDVEVIKDDQKMVLQQGRLQFVIEGYYILDYKGEWKGGFQERMQKIYHDFVINRDIMFKIDKNLYKQVYHLYDEIKDNLGMEQT